MSSNVVLLAAALVLAVIGVYFGFSAFKEHRVKSRTFKR